MISEVYLMDCMEYMAKVPDKWFDLAVVDPPYGIGEDGHCRTRKKHNNKVKHIKKNWDNERPTPEYWKELKRISQNQIVWGANYFTEYLPPSMGWIFWNKKIGGDFSDGELAYTSFDVALKMFTFWNGNNGIARIHPTQKPIKLYSWIYSNYLPQGGRVIDTHLGSGSNRIAADKAGNIDFYATEIDKDYFDAQEKRWRDYKAQAVLTFPERIEPKQTDLF